MDRPQAGGYNIYEIALSLRQTDVVSVTRVSNCGPQRMSLLTRFGRVFPNFFKSRSNVSLVLAHVEVGANVIAIEG